MGLGHGHGHGHGHGTLDTSSQGLRTLWISFGVLLVTACAQAVLVTVTGSVALLGDTLHNAADALTAIPLAVAFLLGRRAATRRFTYGLGRAEDLAGLVIVAVIAASAALAAWQAVDRLTEPRDLEHAGWVAAAGVVGFAGNELVARYRITVGRRIGSAALVADGLHARADGFTSLAVVAAAVGSAIGWRWVDPVVGLAIAAMILSVMWGAAREVFARLLDAVDPSLVDRAEEALRATDGVRGVGWVRLRWVGHSLAAEADVEVAPHLTVVDAHTIAHDAEHRLIHALPRLAMATIHPSPTDAHRRSRSSL
jgi:cation diffusion facilitator family transporter